MPDDISNPYAAPRANEHLELERTVWPRPFKLLLQMTVGTFGMTFGSLLLVTPILGSIWGLRVAVIVFVIAATVTSWLILSCLLYGLPRVEVTSEGFAVRHFLHALSRRWADIDGAFEHVRAGIFIGMVGYHLTPEAKERYRIQKRKLPQGKDEVIGGPLPMQELATLLNAAKREFLAQPTIPKTPS